VRVSVFMFVWVAVELFRFSFAGKTIKSEQVVNGAQWPVSLEYSPKIKNQGG